MSARVSKQKRMYEWLVAVEVMVTSARGESVAATGERITPSALRTVLLGERACGDGERRYTPVSPGLPNALVMEGDALTHTGAVSHRPIIPAKGILDDEDKDKDKDEDEGAAGVAAVEGITSI
jgi:hypothetical protein